MFERLIMPLMIVIFSSCYNHSYASSCSSACSSSALDAHWVTVEALAKSLENVKPLNVGFDVDDTVLFTAPAFIHSLNKFCPEVAINLEDKEKMYECIGTHKFWDYNNQHNDYNIPKIIARKLLALHEARKDNIYFITMRPNNLTGHETVTAAIQKYFGLKNVNPVIFLGDLTDFHRKAPKAPMIKELDIKLFYGDADSDMESAIAAGARPIRVMRAANSYELPLPLNGGMGEEVIENSDI